MKQAVSTFWFVEPVGVNNDHTNAVFARELENKEPVRGKVCADKKKHNLWPCSHLEVQRLKDSQSGLQIRFRVFVQHGPHGAISEWKFDNRRSSKKKLALAA